MSIDVNVVFRSSYRESWELLVKPDNESVDRFVTNAWDIVKNLDSQGFSIDEYVVGLFIRASIKKSNFSEVTKKLTAASIMSVGEVHISLEDGNPTSCRFKGLINI